MDILGDVRQRHIEAYFNAEEDIKTNRVTIAPDVLAEALAMFHRTVVAAKGLSAAQYEILARHFTEALTAQERRRSASIPSPVFNGIMLRAAIRSGLLTGITEEEVGDLSGAEIVRVATDISAALAKAYEIPGK